MWILEVSHQEQNDGVEPLRHLWWCVNVLRKQGDSIAEIALADNPVVTDRGSHPSVIRLLHGLYVFSRYFCCGEKE
ncbi:hypothetical protein DMENIID0001_079160 [Sergentomyia squamirostris]